MKLAMAAAMKELDRRAIEDTGLPSTLLMENAAAQVAAAALEYLPARGRAAVFAGSGNNGGDGVAAARRLLESGHEVRLFLVGLPEKMTADTQEMTRRLEEAGGRVELFNTSCIPFCEQADVLIDAMFGTGLRSALQGPALEAARLMNRLPAPVVSADIASGIPADTGLPLGEAVQADKTITFSFGKPGQFSGPGAFFSGDVRVCDIGIPKELLADFASDCFAVTAADMHHALPRRRRDGHKGSFGKLLILAGSRGFTGAPALAAKAALRAGAGLVFLGVPVDIYAIEASKCEEAMPFPLPCDGEGRLSRAALPEIEKRLSGCDLCLLGPGLGRSPDLTDLVAQMVVSAPMPIVLDADGINALSGNIDILKKAKAERILTPHEGEFARLSQTLHKKDRLSAAREFAEAYGVTLVLKGPGTVTAFPNGRVFLNTSGGPALAKGGTGDVLAGMLAALYAQGVSPEKAVWLHGRAADLYTAGGEDYSMLASDLIDLLPKAISETFLD